MSKKNIAIIDGDSLIKDGRIDLANAAMVARILLKEYLPDFTACVFSEEHRGKDSLKLESLLAALGYTTVYTENPKDTIASYTTDKSFILATNNRSLCQHIGEDSLVYAISSQSIISEQSFKNMLSMPPVAVPYFLAMCGDIDNGVEPATYSDPSVVANFIAQNIDDKDFINKLTSEFKLTTDVSSITANIQRLKGSALPSVKINSIARKAITADNLYQAYIDNGLYSWIPDNMRMKNQLPIDDSLNSRYLMGEDNLELAKHYIGTKKSCFVYVDNLCNSNELVSIAPDQSECFIFRSQSPELIELLNFIQENKDIKFATNNVKGVIRALDLDDSFKGRVISDMDLGYHVHNSRNSKVSFHERIKSISNITVRSDRDAIKSERMHDTLSLIADKTDASLRATRRLHGLLKAQGLDTYMQEIEIPSAFVIEKMESQGVKVDYNRISEMHTEISERVARLEKDVQDLTGHVFNVGSAPKLAEVLYDKLKIKPVNSKRSTDANTLAIIEKLHPSIPKILEYRKYSYIRDNVITPIMSRTSVDEPLVRCTITQDVTATGRLSTIDPNLQGMPSKDSDAKRVKTAFVSDFEDGRILSCDYSQIELRVLAELSQDQKLIEAFNKGKDIHRSTASEVFSIPENLVSDEQRRAAKAINFGIIYGMSAYGLAKQINCSTEDAGSYMTRYFAKYPAVTTFLNHTKMQAIQNGYVETMFGRRITTPGADSNETKVRERALRQAINAPMQGSAAEIVKKAMIHVDNAMVSAGMKSKMTLQVHDELVFDVHPSEAASLPLLVKNTMEAVVKLSVPLIVDAEMGMNWGKVQSIDVNSIKKPNKDNVLSR
ncbi:DNA polymerase [Vibrio splendidus]|nr:DNA polymerase [Vibrio splendidus]MCC4883245.1 DNA polymerase [Vibrio splendidus]